MAGSRWSSWRRPVPRIGAEDCIRSRKPSRASKTCESRSPAVGSLSRARRMAAASLSSVMGPAPAADAPRPARLRRGSAGRQTIRRTANPISTAPPRQRRQGLTPRSNSSPAHTASAIQEASVAHRATALPDGAIQATACARTNAHRGRFGHWPITMRPLVRSRKIHSKIAQLPRRNRQVHPLLKGGSALGNAAKTTNEPHGLAASRLPGPALSATPPAVARAGWPAPAMSESREARSAQPAIWMIPAIDQPKRSVSRPSV